MDSEIVWRVEDEPLYLPMLAASEFISGRGGEVFEAGGGPVVNTVVRYDPDLSSIAFARAFWNWEGRGIHKISVGPKFYEVETGRQEVVFVHEIMHLQGEEHSPECGDVMHTRVTCPPETLEGIRGG